MNMRKSYGRPIPLILNNLHQFPHYSLSTQPQCTLKSLKTLKMPKTTRSCLNLLLEDDAMLDNLTVARAGIDSNNHDNPCFEISQEHNEKEKEDIITNLANQISERVLNDAIEEAQHVSASSDLVKDERYHIENEIESTELFDKSEIENRDELEIDFQKERLDKWLYRNIKQRYLIMDNILDEDDEIINSFMDSNCTEHIGDPYKSLCSTEIAQIEGKVDKAGKPVGKCAVTLKNGDILVGSWEMGKRKGKGSMTGQCSEKRGIHLIKGYYSDGVLDGFGHVLLTNGLEFDCFFKSGFVHGPVVARLQKTARELDKETINAEGRVTGDFLGVYRSGVRSGYIWQGMLGGGWLHGKVDELGHLTGDDVMYVYPDLGTCLYGIFVKGVMVAARKTKIIEVDFTKFIPEVRVNLPNKKSPIYSYSPATSTQLTVERHLSDPYEQSYVCVKSSSVTDGGEGLFARRNILEGTVISFYHGLLFQPWESSPNQMSDYMIYLDWNLAPNSPSMDLPSSCWSTANYTASLAHKTNHSFRPNCVFSRFHHPRFGLNCLGLKTTKNIMAGEELFAHYRYSYSYAPQWFLDMVDI